MKTYKVIAPASVITRRISRTFERSETAVTEAEIESVIAHIRACFEENIPPKVEEAPCPPPE